MGKVAVDDGEETEDLARRLAPNHSTAGQLRPQYSCWNIDCVVCTEVGRAGTADWEPGSGIGPTVLLLLRCSVYWRVATNAKVHSHHVLCWCTFPRSTARPSWCVEWMEQAPTPSPSRTNSWLEIMGWCLPDCRLGIIQDPKAGTDWIYAAGVLGKHLDSFFGDTSRGLTDCQPMYKKAWRLWIQSLPYGKLIETSTGCELQQLAEK